MGRGRAGRWIAVAAGVAACTALGCAASGSRGSAQAGASKPAPELAASPAERGIANGLELVWWVVDDQEGVLGQTLAGQGEAPPGLDPAMAQRWRDCGLRVIALPMSRMPSVTADLPLMGRVQREWMGQLPRWTVAVRGSAGDAITLAMPEGPLTLAPGRLRLLVRCWLDPTPMPQGGASLRIELAPQHEERLDESRAYQSALGLAPRPGIASEGVVFTSMLLSLQAHEDFAYLIIPEAPEVEWKSERPEGADRESLPVAQTRRDAPPVTTDGLPIPFDDSADPAPNDGRDKPELPVRARRESASPSSTPFRLRTLGEAMLTDAPGGGQARAKVVLALIPRVPSTYRLLGD